MERHKPLSPRIPIIDVARGIALMAMTIYHFGWDLDAFGWLEPGSATSGGWRLFARSIASSFLFLVGVSLVLAHGSGIRWSSFWKRWLQVTSAAALVSIASYVQVTWPQIDFLFSYARESRDWAEIFTPSAWPAPGRGFIFFGILHAIALFSLIALLALRLHWAMNIALAGGVLMVAGLVESATFNPMSLAWVGLGTVAVPSNDHVPLFPWFAAVLLGVAAAQLATRLNIWPRLANVKTKIDRPLGFIGRHSLIYYLLHQPVLIAGLWLFTTYVAQPDPRPGFVAACERSCSAERDTAFCTQYCGCVADGLEQQNITLQLRSWDLTEDENQTLQTTIRQCAGSFE